MSLISYGDGHTEGNLMKKKIGILLVLAVNTLTAHETGERHDHVTITQFCEKYHQRSYFIMRLEQIIELIKKFESKPFTFQFNRTQYTNPLILQCIDEIEKNNSIQPFFKLWKDTRRFKYLEDESFALSVTKLLFTIQHAIYTQKKGSEMRDGFDIELHLGCSSYTEATTFRKYHSKRLAETYAFLKNIRCTEQSLFEEKHEGCDCTFITHYAFTSSAIVDCIKKMEEEKTLRPLLQLHKEFTSYKLIQNELFVREFTTLTFIVARNIFINNIQMMPTAQQKRAKSQVTHIYENLDNLPIEEILDAIDLLNDELPEILEQYEFNSDMTWKEWLKKYWWVPPTVLLTVGMRIREIFYPTKKINDDDERGKRMSEGARKLAAALLAKKDDKGGSYDPSHAARARSVSASKTRLQGQAQKLRRGNNAGAGAQLRPPASQPHTRLRDVDKRDKMRISGSHDGLPCLPRCSNPVHVQPDEPAPNTKESDSSSSSSASVSIGSPFDGSDDDNFPDVGATSAPVPRRPQGHPKDNVKFE